MTKKDVLTVTGKLYKLPVAKVNEAFKFTDTTPDDEEIEDKAVLDFFEVQQKAVIKARYDAGYKVAEAKVKETLEKEIKDAYKIEDTDPENPLTGIDLVKHVIELQTKEDPKNPKKAKDLTDDEVKKHPVYLKLEKDTAEQVKKVTEDATKKVKDLQEAENYKTVLSEVDAEALKYLQEIGEADLPADKAKADLMVRKLLLDEIKRGRKFEKQKDKSFLLLDEDGKRVEDELGHPVTLKDVVTNVATEAFTFKKTVERKMPNNGDPTKRKTGEATEADKVKKYTGSAPKDAAAYVALITDQSIDAEIRSDAQAQFGSQFAV